MPSSSTPPLRRALHDLRNHLNNIYMIVAVIQTRSRQGQPVDLEQQTETLMRNARSAQALVEELQQQARDFAPDEPSAGGQPDGSSRSSR